MARTTASLPYFLRIVLRYNHKVETCLAFVHRAVFAFCSAPLSGWPSACTLTLCFLVSSETRPEELPPLMEGRDPDELM